MLRRRTAGLTSAAFMLLAATAFSLQLATQHPVQAGGPSAEVTVGPGQTFSPNVVDIDVEGVVTWTFAGGTHSVVCNPNFCNSGDPQSSGEFAVQFFDEGVVYFYCEVHADVEDANEEGLKAGEMVGRLTVGDPASPTPSSTTPATPTATATATTPVSPTASPTAPASPTPTSEPLQFDLFEGWNLPWYPPESGWPGTTLSNGQDDVSRGEDEITAFFNENVDPSVWVSLARYDVADDLWRQHFNDPPLAAFQTLPTIEPGDALWIFATTDATLTIP